MIIAKYWKKLVRAVTFDKSLGIYINGTHNDYSEHMRVIRDNSVTAKMASDKFSQFVIGKGFGEDIDSLSVGKSDLIDFTEDTTRNITDEKGVFILVQYNLLYEISSLEVLPFSSCRLGKRDDNKYSGKILVCDDWSCAKKDNVKIYDRYSENKEVTKLRVKKQCRGDVTAYKGEVFYYNMDRQYIYPQSRIHTVDLECENEKQSSIYKNRNLKHGFFGKTIVITRPLVDKTLKDVDDDIVRRQYNDSISELENFTETIQTFIGSEDVGGAIHLQVDFAGEKLEDAITIKQVESKIDDKMFSYTESSAQSKILMAYNNLPEALIKNPDNSLFGTGGEALTELKRSFQENVDRERDIVEKIVNKLFGRTPAGIELGHKVKLLLLIPPKKPAEETITK